MEQELIRFAKVHGCINASIMMCTGIALAVSLDEREVVGGPFVVPIAIALWSISPILVVVGCIREDANWLKPAKQLHIIGSIAGVLLVLLKIVDFHLYSTGATLALFVASFYGLYVLCFLEKLFVTLMQRRTGIVSITAIVCDDPAMVPLPVEQPDGSFFVPVIPPPSRPAPFAPQATTSTPQAKEFPTWT